MNAHTDADDDSHTAATTTSVPAARAAVSTAHEGDRLHVTTDRVDDTLRVTSVERDGETRILRLDRDGLPDAHDVSIRYTSFWADAPATAPVLIVAGPDGAYSGQEIEAARVSPDR